MSWTDPTALATAARTSLLACSAWTAFVDDAGNESDYIHYPDADAPDFDSLPLAIIVPQESRRRRIAEGMRGIPEGTVMYEIHADPTAVTAGEMEELGEDLADQLVEQVTGLVIQDAVHELSTDPTDAERAGGDPLRSIVIEITFGQE